MRLSRMLSIMGLLLIAVLIGAFLTSHAAAQSTSPSGFPNLLRGAGIVLAPQQWSSGWQVSHVAYPVTAGPKAGTWNIVQYWYDPASGTLTPIVYEDVGGSNGPGDTPAVVGPLTR